jgi:hypothetical protein
MVLKLARKVEARSVSTEDAPSELDHLIAGSGMLNSAALELRPEVFLRPVTE